MPNEMSSKLSLPACHRNPCPSSTASCLSVVVSHTRIVLSALAEAIGVDRHTLRTHIIELERANKVVSSGSTHDRRIALAATSAKEALRR